MWAFTAGTAPAVDVVSKQVAPKVFQWRCDKSSACFRETSANGVWVQLEGTELSLEARGFARGQRGMGMV